MERNHYSEQAYLFSLKSFKDERRKLISDILEQSFDLYEALYENKNVILRNILFERYELLSIKRHWEETIAQLGSSSETEYYANLKLFVKSYRRYVTNIKGTILNMEFLEVNLEALEHLIEANKIWDKDIRKLHIDFLKGEKEFDDLIKSLKK